MVVKSNTLDRISPPEIGKEFCVAVDYARAGRRRAVHGHWHGRHIVAAGRPAYSGNNIGFGIVPLDRRVRQSTIGLWASTAGS
jgi:hypothetical protein